MKPRIYWGRGRWWCEAAHGLGMGDSPNAAYEMWIYQMETWRQFTRTISKEAA